MLKLIKLECGDAALIVNDHVVMTADPCMDDTNHVEMVAEALAVALNEGLITVARPTPDDEEWTWTEVVTAMQIERPSLSAQDIEKRQSELAQEAYENYQFSEGAQVVGSNEWATGTNNGHDDWTKVVFVECDDDAPNEPSHKVSFHAKFKQGSTALAAAYALWCATGAEIGFAEPRAIPAASGATIVLAGSQP